MARKDSESGRKTPDYPAQMRDSTSNDGNESPFSSDSDNTAIFTPSLADEIFSPSESIVTDITDDYGWETPVKGTSIARPVNGNILGSPQNEIENKLQKIDELSQQDKRSNTQTRSTVSRTRTKSASSHEFEAKTLSRGSAKTSVTSFEKRKQGPDSPVDDDTLNLDQGQIWGESITLPKPKTQKRLHQIEFFTPGPNEHIDIKFSTEQTWIFTAKIRRRRASDVGRAIKPTPDTAVFCTEKQDVDHIPPKPASQSIPDITLSPPEVNQTDRKVGDAYMPPSKSVLLGDGTIQHVLSLLSNQSVSALSAKEQKLIEASLSKILPIEIREHLEEDTHHCPAWTIKNRRCRRIHKSNHSKMMQYLDNITKIKSNQLPKALNDMISTALCSATHQLKAREELEKWMVDIEKLCEIHADIKGTTAVSADNRLLALANWIRILSGGKGLPQRQSVVVSSSPPQPKVEESNHSIASQGEYRLLQYFKPYITKKLKNVSVPEALERLLLEPIRKKKEIEKAGIMYVYWQPSNFGHLKIGYTTRDFEQRMQGWISRCNKTMEIYFPNRNDVQDFIPVSHVYRVERLVHMELKNLRRIEQNCPGCGKDHIEWFEVSRDLAVAVVRKWMAWMRESPYEKRPGSSDEWVLKAEQRSKVKALSEPIKGISVTAQAMEKGRNQHPRQARRLSTGRLPRMRAKSM